MVAGNAPRLPPTRPGSPDIDKPHGKSVVLLRAKTILAMAARVRRVMASASWASASRVKALNALVVAILDSGATHHLWPFYKAFVS